MNWAFPLLALQFMNILSNNLQYFNIIIFTHFSLGFFYTFISLFY